MKPRPDEADDSLAARKAALDLLARREHSLRELSHKLRHRGHEEGVIDAVLDALSAEGLLSNARFAESFVHSRVQRGQGPQKIRAQLHERGIDDALIDACLDSSDPQWREHIAAVREKRFGIAMPADYRERSRQMRFLQQRGFTSEQISGLFSDTD